MGQVKTDAKSNEITAIPKLLDLLDVAGCVVTIDAMGCQKQIARPIRDEGADYVLALKGNQASLADDVEAYFNDALARDLENRHVTRFESTDYEHGRVETRRAYVSSETEWLMGRDDEGDWEGLASIAMVESLRTVGGKTTHSRRLYLTSLLADAERPAKAGRAHSSIENQLHWTLDVSFNEAQSRIRKDNAAENLAILPHLALDMLRQETTAKMGVKAKRLKAGWDQDDLLQVLTN